MVFYSFEPWGEQRADMRMARMVATLLSPHLRPGAKIDPLDFMLFPDDANDLPDGITEHERRLMLKLNRSGH